ncbi:FAD-binding oxidoreductase [Aspergillus affinis]|uniref:FAD-binding oxidoreductase n=1 Tax=Aspergillus affinis TaxID=1070780 RepID=UPI0022FE0FF8|nr:uncharacterized protein KD926_000794 [Aspergillus affinis]KAI9037146.1 hypothetical protein KD926_000794 [Aspergillus affinis]
MAISDIALQSLRGSLTSSTIYTPSDPGYQESLRRWSDTGVKQAGVVVQPTETTDVRAALLWAQEHSLDFAVKGGGHSVSGTSSSEGGLVIDLSRMNHVTVHEESKTLTVQGGAVWKDVDEKAAQYGLAAVGGTVNHTGVGGLTLGGGYGWLSGMYGLTIDNLLAATVVLPNGEIVSASESSHPDLFWGLRGAGYNFGVAVDFTFQGYEQTNSVYSGIVSFGPEKLESVISALNKQMENPDPKAGVMCILAQPPGAPTLMVNVLVFYNGTQEEGESRFAELLALEPVANMISMIPYSQLNSLQNPMATYGDRKTFKGLFFQTPLNAGFLRTVLDDLNAKNDAHPDLIPALLLEWYDMRKTCSVPLDATAFANRSATQNGLLNLRWSGTEMDGTHRAWAREIQASFKSEFERVHGKGGEDDDVPQYINYAEPGDAVVNNIYGQNLQRLRDVKKRYDPGNVFNKMHPIVIDQLWELENNFWTQFLYPANVKQINATDESVFAEDVQGRVDITRTFDGRELNNEYIFGLFTQPDTVSLTGVPINYNITQFAANQNIASATTVLTFNVTTFGVLLPLVIDTWIEFNADGKIAQYDATFRWFDYFVSTLLGVAAKRFNTTDEAEVQKQVAGIVAPTVCDQSMKYCGDYEHYESRDQCIEYLTKETRFGQPFELGKNTLLCREVHKHMVGYRPDIHCSHIAPSGGAYCVDDMDYQQVVLQKYFEDSWVANGFADENIWVA